MVSKMQDTSIELTRTRDDKLEAQVLPVEHADGEDATARQQDRKHVSFYMSMLMLAMIALIIAWDVTALSLALPVIADQLKGTTFQSFWSSIAYILGIAVTQPIYASISDVIGRKSVLYAANVLFVLGSIIFATATNMNVIIIGRLFQGFGGGGLDVLQTIILCDITTLKERSRWLGILSMANAVGAVSGPFIGGVFAQNIGWQWLGWINVIIAAITSGLAVFFLHLTPIEGHISDKLKKLDWAGFALFTVIGTAIALPLSWAQNLYSWSSWQTIVPLVVGIALLVPFGFVERRATVPMIPYHIFNNISIVTGIVSGFLYGAIMNAVLLYLPLFYEAVHLETPLQASVSILPLCALFVAMSIIVSLVIDWTRRYRIALWVGWSLTTIFLGLNYIVGAGTSRAETYALQALLGAGMGMSLVGTMITVLASVKKVDDEGLAAGMLVTARFLGSLIGLAICSTVFSSIFQRNLSFLQDLPDQLAVLKDATQAVSFIPRLRDVDVPEDVMRSVIDAYAGSFQTVWVVLAAFSALAALLSILTREQSLEKDDVGRQGLKNPTTEQKT